MDGNPKTFFYPLIILLGVSILGCLLRFVVLGDFFIYEPDVTPPESFMDKLNEISVVGI